MATSNAENLLNSWWPDYNNKEKVKNDHVMMQALYDNLHNYMYTIANSNVLNGISAEMTFQEQEKAPWEKMLVGGAVVFGILTAGTVAMVFIPFDKILRRKDDER